MGLLQFRNTPSSNILANLPNAPVLWANTVKLLFTRRKKALRKFNLLNKAKKFKKI